jgi:hypothetical protein
MGIVVKLSQSVSFLQSLVLCVRVLKDVPQIGLREFRLRHIYGEGLRLIWHLRSRRSQIRFEPRRDSKTPISHVGNIHIRLVDGALVARESVHGFVKIVTELDVWTTEFFPAIVNRLRDGP